MQSFFNKYLNSKNRNLLLICVIVLSIAFMYNYYKNQPTYMDKYDATNTYKDPTTGNEDYSLTSDKYQIGENYIYYGTDSLMYVSDNVSCTNCSVNINDNQLEVIYDGNTVKTYDLVGVGSKSLDYKFLDDYLYYGFKDSVDTSKINCLNCTASIENNNLVIKYNDTINVKEYILLGLTTTYSINNRTIYVGKDYGDDEAIINNINKSVCAIEIENNKHLQVKYNNNVIDNYGIAISEELTVAQDYIIDENRMILYGIGANKTASSLLAEIDSPATKTILNKNGVVVDDDKKVCTGYTLRMVFDNNLANPTEYKISVAGDVLGTGGPSIDNAKRIAKHIVDKNAIAGEEYLTAADYDGNGVIKMNDVVHMLVDMEHPLEDDDDLLPLMP